MPSQRVFDFSGMDGPDADRELFLAVVCSYLGTFYIWGGDDPSGFDCSGITMEGFKSVGTFAEKVDLTAADLSRHFAPQARPDPARGRLAFWRRPGGPIVHVEVCLDQLFSIGARGGGSSVKTVADAITQNAYVKIRPIYGREWKLELAGFVDPFAAE